MIVALKNHNPDIELKDQVSSITSNSELTNIFERTDIVKAFKDVKFDE